MTCQCLVKDAWSTNGACSYRVCRLILKIAPSKGWCIFRPGESVISIIIWISKNNTVVSVGPVFFAGGWGDVVDLAQLPLHWLRSLLSMFFSDNFQDQMKRELSYREEMVQQLHIVRGETNKAEGADTAAMHSVDWSHSFTITYLPAWLMMLKRVCVFNSLHQSNI